MKCKLTKLKLGEAHKGVDPVRTETVEGVAINEPTVGMRFHLYGQALDPDIRAQGGHREFVSNVVTEIVEQGVMAEFLNIAGPTGGGPHYWVFQTKSGSVYRVEEIDGE
jgi:hypothetical protein